MFIDDLNEETLVPERDGGGKEDTRDGEAEGLKSKGVKEEKQGWRDKRVDAKKERKEWIERQEDGRMKGKTEWIEG